MTLNNKNNNECCKCTTPEITIELNQQGPQGRQGKPGLDGFSPQVDILSNTNDTYILQITTKDGNITTPNLKATLPPGGNEGDVLTKNSDNNGDVTWINLDSKFVTVQGDQEIEGAKTFSEDIHLSQGSFIRGLEDTLLLGQSSDIEIKIGDSSISSIYLQTKETGNIYTSKIDPDTDVTTKYKILHQGNVTAGDNVTITPTDNGIQIASTTEPYTLPPATTTTLGGVKPDGSTITVTSDGTISANTTTPANMVTTDTNQSITGTKTFNKIILSDDSFDGGIYIGDNSNPSINAYNGSLIIADLSTLSLKGSLYMDGDYPSLNLGNYKNNTRFEINLQGYDNNSGSTKHYPIIQAMNINKSITFGNTDCQLQLLGSSIVNGSGQAFINTGNFATLAPTGALKYWTGTEAEYTGLTTKDADTLYRTTDTNAVYLGTILLSGGSNTNNQFNPISNNGYTTTEDIIIE